MPDLAPVGPTVTLQPRELHRLARQSDSPSSPRATKAQSNRLRELHSRPGAMIAIQRPEMDAAVEIILPLRFYRISVSGICDRHDSPCLHA